MSWNSGGCRTAGHGYWSGSDGLVEIDADTVDDGGDDTTEHVGCEQ